MHTQKMHKMPDFVPPLFLQDKLHEKLSSRTVRLGVVQ